MIRIRRADSRGQFRNHWLDARFTFSFGDYRDPAFDGYSDLWVLNDDRVAPGAGFAEHGHRDVEVMSYPLAGAIEHRDSLGHVAIMRPGDVHLMRAGRGIRHSEMNASATEPEHHLQWWIVPARSGLAPGYQRIHVPEADKRNRWRLIGAPDGAEDAEDALAIAQDVRIYATLLTQGELACPLPPGRRGFLHVAAGAVVLNDVPLDSGDAAFIEDEAEVLLRAVPGRTGELLLFDLR